MRIYAIFNSPGKKDGAVIRRIFLLIRKICQYTKEDEREGVL